MEKSVEKCQTCPHPFILKCEKPSTIRSPAPEPAVPEIQVLSEMKVAKQCSTAGHSTVPHAAEPAVPATQVLPVIKVSKQCGTTGPSTVPPTQISALSFKDTTQNSTALSTDKIAET